MSRSRVRLKALAEVRLSSVDKRAGPGELPVRLCNYTDVYYRDQIYADQEFMAATATQSEIARFRLQPGDIVITKDSESPDDIGVAARVESADPSLVCGYHLALIRPRTDRVDPHFLYWAIRSQEVQSQLSAAATGVTRFGLRAQAIKDIEMTVPPMGEQRAIAALLQAELSAQWSVAAANRQARGLIEERWHALLHAVLGERRPPTAQHASEIEDFRRRRLKHVAGLVAGGTPRTDNPTFWAREAEPGTPWVAIRDMTRADPVVETARRVTDDGRRAARLTVGPPGTILFSMYASLGKVAETAVPACWNQAILGVFPDPEVVTPRFLKYALAALQPRLAQQARSNTQANLNAEQVGNLLVACPDLETQERLARFVDQQRERHLAIAAALDRQLRLLDERRDALITAAIAGQLNEATRASDPIAVS